jgi:hypothetical protein
VPGSGAKQPTPACKIPPRRALFVNKLLSASKEDALSVTQVLWAGISFYIFLPQPLILSLSKDERTCTAYMVRQAHNEGRGDWGVKFENNLWLSRT